MQILLNQPYTFLEFTQQTFSCDGSGDEGYISTSAYIADQSSSRVALQSIVEDANYKEDLDDIAIDGGEEFLRVESGEPCCLPEVWTLSYSRDQYTSIKIQECHFIPDTWTVNHLINAYCSGVRE